MLIVWSHSWAQAHHCLAEVAIDGKSIEKKKKKKKKQSVDVPEAAADTQKGKKDEFFADEDPSDGKKPDGAKKQKKDKKRKHADENGAALQPEGTAPALETCLNLKSESHPLARGASECMEYFNLRV